MSGGGCVLYAPELDANAVYVLTGYRRPAAPQTTTDSIVMAEQYQDVVVTTAAWLCAKELMREPGVLREDRDRWRERWLEIGVDRKGMVDQLGLFQTQRSPRRRPLVAV